MVIGSGIFKSTPLAAAVDSSDAALLLLWVFGGAMSLAGALCFAELAAAFPDPGGDYFFLRKAYGAEAGFLFAWSRFAVIHTGSMALLAFSFGDYLSAGFDVGLYGSAALAAATIVLLAAVNLAGLRFGIGTQVALLFVVIAGLVCVGAAAVWLAITGQPPRPSTELVAGAPAAAPLASVTVGTALVYVFLAYGGWSDAATLSAEMRDRERGMMRALIGGMGIVTILYVFVNWAFLRGLGRDGFVGSNAPSADLMRYVFGVPGELAIVAVVAVTSITSMNAILIAGARTTYAAARDTEPFRVPLYPYVPLAFIASSV
jgi:APA family basic amino acid/polyamine antiporter